MISFKMKEPKYFILSLVVLFSYLGINIFIRLHGAFFYINTTPSQPLGIYQALKFDGRLETGDLVIFKPPQKIHPYVYGRGWMKEGELMLKNVGALPGDIYEVTDEAIMINGQHVGPIATVDRKGLPLPRLRGRFKVKEGGFLPISTHIPNSFDGRYFGAVSTKQIKAKAVLVYKFKNQKKTNTGN